MEFTESSQLELKEIVNTDFKKEIIAFANSEGGEIYVGVSRDGEIIGIENAEKEISRKDVELLLGCSGFPARKVLMSLLSQGKIRVTGKAKATKYVLNF